jgi:branched-chain amino acid aminotransferase
MSNLRIWHDGRLMGEGEAGTSPMAPVMHYGLGVFEGIRAYATPAGPAIFRLKEHMERMARGAAVLGLDFDPEACARGCCEVLADAGLKEAYVRPLVYFAGGDLSLDTHGGVSRTMVAAIPWRNHLGEGALEGVRAQLSPMRRNRHLAIPPLKLCGGYVNSILAKKAASRAGFQEAVFQDDQGCVVEATGENVFMVNGGKVTAVEHADALPGITRATVMELAGAQARPVRLEELLDADELFLTGTSGEVVPVSALGERAWKPGKVSLELAAAYSEIVHGKVADRMGWLTVVQ